MLQKAMCIENLNLNAKVFVRNLYDNNLVVKSGCIFNMNICKISGKNRVKFMT